MNNDGQTILAEKISAAFGKRGGGVAQSPPRSHLLAELVVLSRRKGRFPAIYIQTSLVMRYLLARCPYLCVRDHALLLKSHYSA